MSSENKSLEQQLAEALAENARLKSKVKEPSPVISIGTKGGVSVKGFGRFPTTLYRDQWPKLLAMADQILAFIEANDEKLVNEGEVRDPTDGSIHREGTPGAVLALQRQAELAAGYEAKREAKAKPSASMTIVKRASA